jgi:hypothetical protein
MGFVLYCVYRAVLHLCKYSKMCKSLSSTKASSIFGYTQKSELGSFLSCQFEICHATWLWKTSSGVQDCCGSCQVSAAYSRRDCTIVLLKLGEAIWRHPWIFLDFLKLWFTAGVSCGWLWTLVRPDS